VFIKSLLNPDPAARPTAEEAFRDPVRLFPCLVILFSVACFFPFLGFTAFCVVCDMDTDFCFFGGYGSG
jgi:hypothetical protein